MNKPARTSILFILGTVLLVGSAAYLLVSSQFDEKDFEFDTYDEHDGDYL